MRNRITPRLRRYTVEDVRPQGRDQVADVTTLVEALAIAQEGRGRYGTQVIRWDGDEPSLVIGLDPLPD